MGRIRALEASTGTSAGTLTPIEGTATAKTADYTVLDDDNIRTILMTTGGTNRTVTLPTATDNTGRILTIKKIDDIDADGTGICTVDGEGSETIDGLTTRVLISAGDHVTLQCTGTAWVILSARTIEYAHNSDSTNSADTTDFVYGPAGSAGVLDSAVTVGSRKRIRFLVPRKATDQFFLEISRGGTGPWQQLIGFDAGNDISYFVLQNTVNYGMGLEYIASGTTTTDMEVQFAGYAAPSGTYGAAGTAWADVAAGTLWRVRKLSIV
jgi:hypothetical protein